MKSTIIIISICIIVLIVGVIFAIILSIKKCKTNYYIENNKCTECCISTSPCLKTDNSKCVLCINFLFDLNNGTCTPTTDINQIKKWLNYWKPKIKNNKKNLDEFKNEFQLWLNYCYTYGGGGIDIDKFLKLFFEFINDIMHNKIDKAFADITLVFKTIINEGMCNAR